jgi:hypothetical protein
MKKVILALILGIGIISCAKLSDPSETLPRDLDLALQSAKEIQGDDDARDKEIRNVAFRLAEVGWTKTAAQILSDLKSYHGVVALCDLSITFAHKNQQSIAQEFYQKATEISHRLVLNIPRPIPIALAYASAANRDFKNADEWAARIGENADQAEVQSKIYAEKLRYGLAVSSETPAAWEPAVFDAWCASMSLHEIKKDDLNSEVLRMMDKIPSMFPVDQPQAYLYVYRAALKFNLPELAQASSMNAIRSSIMLGSDMDDTPKIRAQVARELFQTGDPRATDVLRSARAACDGQVGFTQPPALGAVAEVMLEMGQQEDALQTWDLAWNKTFTHGHPRARMVNAVEVLLSQSRAGIKLDDKRESTVMAIRRGESGLIQPQTEPTQEVLYEVGAILQQQSAAKQEPKRNKSTTSKPKSKGSN